MPISDEKNLEILYDHYKDSFTHILAYQKLRNRLFLYAVGLLTLLQVSTPDTGPPALQAVVKDKLGVDIQLSPALLGALLGIVLLVVVLRYFQTSATIDLQYRILHGQEEELCRLLGREAIVRERTGYKRGTAKPAFQKLVAVLYRWCFPLLLLLMTLRELRDVTQALDSPVIAVKGLFFLAVAVTTAAYLWMLHRPSKGLAKA